MKPTRRVFWLSVLALVLLLVFFGQGLIGLLVDWIWFGELGQRAVLRTILGTQLVFGLLSGAALGLLVYVNLAIARRACPPLTGRLGRHPLQERVDLLVRTGTRVLLLGAAAFVGLLAAVDASQRWEDFLLFRHPQQFGSVDPVFGRDLGFYFFTLPFWKYLYGWAFAAGGLAVVGAALVYAANGGVDFRRGLPRVAVPARIHLSVLLGGLALVLAWGYRIDAYDLLFKDHPRYFGAGYVDLHAQLAALNILAVVAVIAAVGFFLNVVLRALWVPVAALLLMVVASVTVGAIYPSLVQRFQVLPNEANLEAPYIARHIQATRAAFGLQGARPRTFSLEGSLTPSVRKREAGTLGDVRLWDYRALVPTYRQLQGLRDYYDLSHIDIDRYVLGGRQRQVMLSARELEASRLSNPSWVASTLQFTHGYGLVMNPVSEVTPSGQPRFLVHSLPLAAAQPDLLPARPQIYFGERTDRPVIAPSKMEEFDFNLEARKEISRYQGARGIPLNSSWARTLFALYLGDWNVVLSNQLTPQSRLLIRRRIDERIARLAPFLALDHDPYLVVTRDRLYWIQDAYTVSDRYPYSQPVEFDGTQLRRGGSRGVEPIDGGSFNYIRNSVKVVVDAYTGETRFYRFDDQDPLLRAYAAIFPSLFLPADRMDPEIRAHVRVPEDLFTVQAVVLSTYHVEDPLVFYNRTSFWSLPRETLEQADGGVAAAPMEPYYVRMRLPGEHREEYVLIQPFVFRGQQNMAAWLAARCDPGHLGEMSLFTFDTYVKGPELIDQAIQSKPEISSELTLLNREGSRVVWGNLLVLPLTNTLLYVRPLYLAASTSDHRETMREFQRVVVAQEDRVVMSDSLTAALDRMTGSAPEPAGPETAGRPSPPPAPGGAAAGGDLRSRAIEADKAFSAAQNALARNDWATFGQQMQRAQRAIRELRRLSGGR